jgi:alpha-galactosidase
VVFQVLADGAPVAGSGLRTGTDAATHLSATLTGAYELTLRVTDGGNGKDYDHADWAAPQLVCG